MPISDALSFLISCTWLSLAGLLVALIYAAFFGRLDLRGLLIDKQSRQFSVARLQLVATAIITSFIYLRTVIDSPLGTTLPELDGTLAAVALSGGVYGVAKINSVVKTKLTVSLLDLLAGSQRRI